jgi:hypothetical protein
MLLEGSKDVDHNLVVYTDKHAVRWGCNAHSGYPHLNGRAAEYFTLRELAESYYPYYYSGETNDPKDLTLVGYSEPFDLVEKYGTAWMASREPAWEIYHTYVDDRSVFYRMFDDSGATHAYPLICALKYKWIETKSVGPTISGDGATAGAGESRRVHQPFVNVNRLPPRAQVLWHEFWETFDPADLIPRGRAYELEQEFFQLTGTTPLDLETNANEYAAYLERGYRPEQLLTVMK